MENNEFDAVVGKEIVILIHKKYQRIDEIYGMTREISEVLQRNDVTSRDMLLSMRLESMIATDEINKELEVSIAKLSPAGRERIYAMLHGEKTEVEIPWEQELKKEYESLTRLLEKTIALDKEISLKLSGNASYYAEREKS